MKSPARQRLGSLAGYVLVPCVLVAVAGCSSTTREVRLYAQGQLVVSLRSFTKGSPALRYDHPATVSPEQVGKILASVGIEEFSFFKWRDKGALLAAEDVSQLAPKLAEGLRRAGPDQWVYFSARNVPRSFTFGAVRFSDGIAFVSGGKLNLVFDNIAYVENVDTQPSRLDPRDAATSETVRLAAKGPDARGAAPALVKGDRWLGHERTNWLVFDLAPSAAPSPQAPAVVATPAAAPTPGAAPASASAPGAVPAVPQDPAERLRNLKSLLDQGLISADEYEKKRQEILKGL